MKITTISGNEIEVHSNEMILGISNSDIVKLPPKKIKEGSWIVITNREKPLASTALKGNAFLKKHPQKLKKLNKLKHNNKIYDFKKIGKLISRERYKHDISQQKLSNLMNIPRSTLINYEYGNALPSKNTLKKISNVLNSKKILKISNQSEYKILKNERKIRSMKTRTTKLYILPKEFTQTIFKEIFYKYNLSQEKISRLINSSQGRIGCYARGDSGISLFKLQEMTNLFDTDKLDYFNKNVWWDKVKTISD